MCSVNLITEIAKVEFDSDVIGPRDIIQEIEVYHSRNRGRDIIQEIEVEISFQRGIQ